MHHIVIMAGGAGTRLWPLSTTDYPKQFHTLTHESITLLQETYERIAPLVPRERRYVATVAPYVDLVREQLPDLPAENIIVEPATRDTAPALTYLVHHIASRDPEAIITTTASDHAIKNPDAYRQALTTALEAAEDFPARFGLIGIAPTEPATELGYIERGQALTKDLFDVAAFKEKPDAETATAYLAAGNYYWNAAYFVFAAKSFLQMIHTHAPHILDTVTRMDDADAQTQRELYEALPKEPIDTVLLEKLTPDERFVLPAPLLWSDIGNWRALQDFHAAPENTTPTHGDVYIKDTVTSYAHNATNKKLILFGVKDVVVVETDDATLVVDRSKAHRIKEILADPNFSEKTDA